MGWPPIIEVSSALPQKIISLLIIPTLQTCAYNSPASVAGVFRETVAGRRGSALSCLAVTCGKGGRGETHGGGQLPLIKPPPGSHAGFG
jgi:hypothetical protein